VIFSLCRGLYDRRARAQAIRSDAGLFTVRPRHHVMVPQGGMSREPISIVERPKRRATDESYCRVSALVPSEAGAGYELFLAYR
jgi:hypothetical protein